FLCCDVRGTVAVPANADIVDQDVGAAEARLSRRDNGCTGAGRGNVGFERGAADLHRRRLRTRAVAVDAEHTRALAGEHGSDGAAIADGLARGLTGADDDGPLAFQSHARRSGSSVWPSSSCTPNVFRNIAIWVYCAAVNTTSIHWRVLKCAVSAAHV